MSKETLEFEFVFDTQTHGNHRFDIVGLFENQPVTEKIIIEPDTDTTLKFDVEVEDDKAYTFGFELSGKSMGATVTDGDGGPIVKDLIANLKSLSIDGIECNYNIKVMNKFTPNHEIVKDSITGDLSYGFNGVCQFEFTTPLYLWLLENM